jgi:hypothetical protein
MVFGIIPLTAKLWHHELAEFEVSGAREQTF